MTTAGAQNEVRWRDLQGGFSSIDTRSCGVELQLLIQERVAHAPPMRAQDAIPPPDRCQRVGLDQQGREFVDRPKTTDL